MVVGLGHVHNLVDHVNNLGLCLGPRGVSLLPALGLKVIEENGGGPGVRLAKLVE